MLPPPAEPPKPSVNIGDKLKGISLEKLDPSAWPSSKFTDDLRDSVESLRKKGVAKPFVYVDLTKKPLAAWALAAPGRAVVEGVLSILCLPWRVLTII